MLQGSVIGFGTNCMSGIYFIWQPDRWLQFSTPVCWVKPWSNRLASWKLGVYLWLCLARPCLHLYWLVITFVKIKFAHKSMQVFYGLATQRKSLYKFYLWVRLTRTLKRTYKPHHVPVTISWSQKTYSSRYFKIRLKGHSSQSIRLQKFTGTVVI